MRNQNSIKSNNFTIEDWKTSENNPLFLKVIRFSTS